MSIMPRICILMTTYNGARFLREQLDSLLAQKNVELYIRIADDCSTDSTRDILQEYAGLHDNIELIFNEKNKGCICNFMDLIYGTNVDSYDYFAISDQDDIWLPNKLEEAVRKLEDAQLSACLGVQNSQGEMLPKPALYYAGIDNVNLAGESLGNEYAQYQICAENYASLLLVQNWCLGCTCLMNACLVKRLQEHHVYDFGRMYDAWIHAVTLYTGGVVINDLQHSFIKRRITGDNTVGIMNEKRSVGFIVKKAFRWLLKGDETSSKKHTKMAQCLFDCYSKYFDDDTKELVDAVARRQVSSSAREFLLKRDDIVMPTRQKTTWLRWMIRLNKF